MKFDENGKRIRDVGSDNRKPEYDPEWDSVRIGLVGSSKAGTKGFEEVSKQVEYWMDITQQANQDIEFASGGGVGIDSTARSVCKKFEVDFKEFKPDGYGWEANKKRNLQIADYCDKVISFALPYGTTIDTKTGEPIPKCYHCAKAGKDDNHEKTAGCYTGKACGAYEVVIL